MPEKKVLSARFQASFLMDNILSEKRLLADLNLNLISIKQQQALVVKWLSRQFVELKFLVRSQARVPKNEERK